MTLKKPNTANFRSLLLTRFILVNLLLALCAVSFAQETSRTSSTDHLGDDLTPVFEKNDLYIEECGSCHIPYPPMLLPIDSWKKIMAGLEDHFGEITDLDAETMEQLINYLAKHSLEKEKDSIVGHWLKTLPANPVLRITELPSFLDDHQDAFKRLGEGSEQPGFMSPCKDCHKEAMDGIFSKDRIFRGSSHLFNRFSGGY